MHTTADLLRLLGAEGRPFGEVAAAVAERFGADPESQAWLARTLITLLRDGLLFSEAEKLNAAYLLRFAAGDTHAAREALLHLTLPESGEPAAVRSWAATLALEAAPGLSLPSQAALLHQLSPQQVAAGTLPPGSNHAQTSGLPSMMPPPGHFPAAADRSPSMPNSNHSSLSADPPWLRSALQQPQPAAEQPAYQPAPPWQHGYQPGSHGPSSAVHQQAPQPAPMQQQPAPFPDAQRAAELKAAQESQAAQQGQQAQQLQQAQLQQAQQAQQAELTRLTTELKQAAQVPLVPAMQQQLIAALGGPLGASLIAPLAQAVDGGTGVGVDSKDVLQPEHMRGLTLHNCAVAAELLAALLARHPEAAAVWAAAVAEMPMCAQSVEVISSAVSRAELPDWVLTTFLSNCMQDTSGVQDGGRQSRQVKLLCACVALMLERQPGALSESLPELQAFCIQQSRHKHASELYRQLQLAAG